MSQDSKDLNQITVDHLKFQFIASGSSTVYEQIIRTYHPTGQMVSEVVQNFYLEYKVYYCDLIKYVLVTFGLHESDKQSMQRHVVHTNQAQMLKAESENLQETVDKFLDHQRVAAADEVRDLLAIDPDEVPF